MANPTKKGSNLPELLPTLPVLITDRVFGLVAGETTKIAPDSLRLYLEQAIEELNASGNIEAAGFTIGGVPLGTSSDTYFSDAGGGDIQYAGGKTKLKLEALDDPDLKGFEIVNTPTISEMQRGKGLHFDVDQSVTVADDTNINFGTDSFSIRFSFRAFLSSVTQYLLNKGGASGNAYNIVLPNDGILVVSVRDNGGASTVISADSALVDGEKYDIETTYNTVTGDFALFINGVKQADVGATQTDSVTSTDALFFARLLSPAFFAKCEIYDVQFLNYADTDGDAVSWTSNPLKQLEFKDIGGSQVELNTDANATADNGGTEANATTGWSSVGLSGTGANVFQSQSGTVATGTYAFEADANDTPTSLARFYKDIHTDFNMEFGKRYRIKHRSRHIGTGGIWEIRLDDASDLSADGTTLESLSNSDTIFTETIFEFTHNEFTQFYGAREVSGANDGGVFFDDFSLVQIGCIAEYRPDTIHGLSWNDAQNSNDGVIDASVINDTTEFETTPMLLKEFTTTEKNAIANPKNGMILFDTTLGKGQIRESGVWVNLV